MDNRNSQIHLEDKAETPGVQPSPAETPGVQPSPASSSTRKKADVEPTVSGASQVEFSDVKEMDREKQPVALQGPERELGHTESTQEGPVELQIQEQKPPERPENESSWATQEGPREPQIGQEQVQPRNEELGSLPSSPCVTPKVLPQSGVQTGDQQERWSNTGAAENQAPESFQILIPPTQDLENPCTLDSWEQPLGDDAPSEAGLPQDRPQEVLPEPGPGADEDSSPEAVPSPQMATADVVPPLLPFTPGSRTPKERAQAGETQAAPRPLPPPEERDIARRRELDQKQLQEVTATQNPGSPRQGFMKCLLDVEEQEEAAHRRSLKGRTLTARRCPRTLTSVSTSGPVSSSVPALPVTLLEPPNSATATVPLWARPQAPGPASAPVGAPGSVLSVPTQDLSWRWPELLSQNERGLSYAKARQEPEEHSFKMHQSWEERSDEHLTLKQEEAFRSYFEIFNGPGEVDARSLKNILLLIGFSLTPAQVEEALMSADVNGDGHVDFKDFLAVMTDTKRFFCSVEQNFLMDLCPPNPYTLLFEVLSLLVETLALPEAALEEITNYYQKKLKEGTSKAREMDSTIGGLRSRKKLSYNPQQVDSLEVPERRVLRILGRLKQQNYAANLQSPYAQVPCVPLCPRLDKKTVRRKQGNHNHSAPDQCVPAGLGPDFHSLFLQSGPQGSREHSSDSRKWLSSVPARTH